MNVTNAYLNTLLSYYEDEIMGEAYFYGLARCFDEFGKCVLLAQVESHAAEAIDPLLKKYDLTPSAESVLRSRGERYVERHSSDSWSKFMTHIIERYPGYVEEFKALERMAPKENLPALELLAQHEVAAIEFAEKEIAGAPDSLIPLRRYLGKLWSIRADQLSVRDLPCPRRGAPSDRPHWGSGGLPKDPHPSERTS